MSDDATIRAGRIGSRVELVDVRLCHIEATLLDPGAQPPFDVELSMTPSHELTDDDVRYSVIYELNAVSAEGSDLLRAKLDFRAIYQLPESAHFDDEDFKAFGRISVLFSLHPYVRETVQSLTARFGLPPLVLGVLRSPLHTPEPDPAKDD